MAKSLAELGNMGVAKSTWNSYKSAKQLVLKCQKETGIKMELPFGEREILIFIDWLARRRNLKGSTINCYLSGIRQMHVIAGVTPPIIRTGLVKLVLKGLTNRDNIASKSEHLSGRLPMTTNVMLLLKKLIERLDGQIRVVSIPNPKSLRGDKANSGIGLRSTLAWVAHGKCVGVDFGVDIR